MRTAHDKVTLEDFSLKGMHYAKMTGVMIATHAISDSFLMMHTGVGCKYKTASQAAQHDLAEHPNVREAWTQVSEAHLVAGCSDRIGPFARAWWERRNSAFMMVVSAYFIELTGDDIPEKVREIEQTIPGCEMAYVPTKAPNGGLFDGFASVLVEVLKRMDWSVPARPREAAVLGHFFTRYEPDQKADVAQLRALIKQAGLNTTSVLFSGAEYSNAKAAPLAAVQVVMPYCATHRSAIGQIVGARQAVDVDLPIGFAGTTRFVRTIAAAAGTDLAAIDAWAIAQTEAVLGNFRRLSEMLARYEWVVFADTPLAAGLVSLLLELGVRVTAVGLREADGALGGRAAFDAVLARNGLQLPDDAVVVEAPSLRRVKQLCVERLQRSLVGILGSTHELAVLRNLSPAERPRNAGVLLEVGFPSDDTHSVLSVPTFGFAGAAAWAQRLVEAVRRPQVSELRHEG